MNKGASKDQKMPATRFTDLPNDCVVSIFMLVEKDVVVEQDRGGSDEATPQTDFAWVRETLPCICKALRDAYDSDSAIPLHQVMVVKPELDSASGALLWAQRHGTRVASLRVEGADPSATLRDFTCEDLAALIKFLPRTLAEISIAKGCGELLGPPFWRSLRAAAAADTLRSLVVEEKHGYLSHDDGEALGRLRGLEKLVIRLIPGRHESLGFWGFPIAVLACTNLRVLALTGHRQIRKLPSEIANLENLEELCLSECYLSRLPGELALLPKLARLDVKGNLMLGLMARHNEDTFPEALGAMNLTHLNLGGWLLSAVPAFVSQLSSLKSLILDGNWTMVRSWTRIEVLPDSAAAALSRLEELSLARCCLSELPPAVLSAMPKLEKLRVARNVLTSLPEDLGQRLPRLKDIDLASNQFQAVPRAALTGATTLESISLAGNLKLQINDRLDFLLESLPRLRKLKLTKGPDDAWTEESAARIAEFAMKLRVEHPSRLFVLEE